MPTALNTLSSFQTDLISLYAAAKISVSLFQLKFALHF